MEKEDKYKNDKYDRALYIPKGYLLPDGTMLTKKYARFHRDMAERFIQENYYQSYQNDCIKDPQEYMLMRLDAVQVMSSGQPILLFCEGYQTPFIQNAIVSYKSYGWKEEIIPNPYASYLKYLRYDLLKNTGLLFEGEKDEEEVSKQYILKRSK